MSDDAKAAAAEFEARWRECRRKHAEDLSRLGQLKTDEILAASKKWADELVGELPKK